MRRIFGRSYGQVHKICNLPNRPTLETSSASLGVIGRARRDCQIAPDCPAGALRPFMLWLNHSNCHR
jgi:hypothetical protein